MAELARIETVLFLRSVDLFKHCTAEQTLRLAAIAREKRFEAGQRIFAAGEPAEVLYCVVQGAVELTGPGDSSELIGPLGTFGVVEILTGRLRTHSAASTISTLVLAMEAEDFFDLLADNIEIVRALFRRFLPADTGSDTAKENA